MSVRNPSVIQSLINLAYLMREELYACVYLHLYIDLGISDLPNPYLLIFFLNREF